MEGQVCVCAWAGWLREQRAEGTCRLWQGAGAARGPAPRRCWVQAGPCAAAGGARRQAAGASGKQRGPATRPQARATPSRERDKQNCGIKGSIKRRKLCRSGAAGRQQCSLGGGTSAVLPPQSLYRMSAFSKPTVGNCGGAERGRGGREGTGGSTGAARRAARAHQRAFTTSQTAAGSAQLR